MQDQLKKLLEPIPQQPQRQDSATAQLSDLYAFANRLGLYDAADLIMGLVLRPEAIFQSHPSLDH